MEIIISTATGRVTLTDVGLNNHNFIELYSETDGTDPDQLVPIEQLYFGVKAFYEKHLENKKENK